MSEPSPDNLFARPITARQARNVARELKTKGYKITAAACRGKTLIDLAWFCEPVPDREEERMALIVAAAILAGIIPKSFVFSGRDLERALSVMGYAGWEIVPKLYAEVD